MSVASITVGIKITHKFIRFFLLKNQPNIPTHANDNTHNIAGKETSQNGELIEVCSILQSIDKLQPIPSIKGKDTTDNGRMTRFFLATNTKNVMVILIKLLRTN